jgi:hypothetical protein
MDVDDANNNAIVTIQHTPQLEPLPLYDEDEWEQSYDDEDKWDQNNKIAADHTYQQAWDENINAAADHTDHQVQNQNNTAADDNNNAATDQTDQQVQDQYNNAAADADHTEENTNAAVDHTDDTNGLAAKPVFVAKLRTERKLKSLATGSDTQRHSKFKNNLEAGNDAKQSRSDKKADQTRFKKKELVNEKRRIAHEKIEQRHNQQELHCLDAITKEMENDVNEGTRILEENHE